LVVKIITDRMARRKMLPKNEGTTSLDHPRKHTASTSVHIIAQPMQLKPISI
jgi:hypothetical protein